MWSRYLKYLMRKKTFLSFFAQSVSSFLFSFQFLRFWAWGYTLPSLLWLFLLFEYFLLWRRFSIIFFTYNLFSWIYRWVSSFTTFFPHCLIIWVLMLIFLFQTIVWIILWHSRRNFEAFLRYKFLQNTNYKSLTFRFTNKVEWTWRIELHVGMSESSLEKAVLDRRRFYEIKLRNMDYGLFTWSSNFRSSAKYSVLVT